ncbi:MAG: NUDIX domain-containing protein [Lachnospiraceae bacterium]|nr:NUDIX domain-containing protein [Lachnospiraceae bacterium]
MKEMFTIYDDNGNEMGTSSREEAHRLGLWHEVVHCWMYCRIGGRVWIYFQQRAHTKKDFPDFYDLTSTGHVDAGESHQEAVIREVREEVGVDMDPKRLTYLGSVKEEIREGDFFDREIGHVYLYQMDIPFFSPGEEVDRMIAVSLEEYEKKELGSAPYIQGCTLDGEPVMIRQEEWCRHDGEYERLVKTALAGCCEQ